jgi:hypothetical protein
LAQPGPRVQLVEELGVLAWPPSLARYEIWKFNVAAGSSILPMVFENQSFKTSACAFA